MPYELTKFLEEARHKLENEKIIFISAIKGEGSERSSRGRGFPRDFYYYNEQSLTNIINNAGFKILYINEPDDKWLQVILTGMSINPNDQ